MNSTSRPQTLDFPSRIDLWIGLALSLPVVLLLGSAVHLLGSGGEVWVPLLILIGHLGILCAFVLPCSYRVTSERLMIRAGLLKESIPLDDVQSVVPTRSILSAPALSLQRLEVRLRSGGVRIVSPRDSEGFRAAVLRMGGVVAENRSGGPTS